MALKDFFRKLTKPGDLGTPQKADNDDREYFGGKLYREFLRGEAVIHLQSSWCAWVKYEPGRNAMIIGFKDGWVQPYGDISLAEAKDFIQAPSKGKWIHAKILGAYNKSTRTWEHLKPRLPA